MLSDSAGGARHLAVKAVETTAEFDTTRFHEAVKELQQASTRCPNFFFNISEHADGETPRDPWPI